ncbi:FKBP-type peptidyl-prolyl cis-trans isomerase 2 [Desulfuromonas soudanensis]|uniref:Peptidyl-prolyl cis-trans isomerase n=1 Tax=Desulfuromonas soudanensis TaxID=1603606 RepID=A0A0M5IYB9_9BACT|nr:peptidylprolyl isomerase [Desulfuromonas soudanensis]ALC15044.1 FKBP-type peptidyl-prolyl cis-trans isomerase 2 [Desulfuromonas soudanensis]
MAQIKTDDTIKVHYTGTLADGTVFDTSRQRDPLEFTVGGGQLIKGFDEAVLGLNVGESTRVTIPAEEAYGPHREEMVLEVELSQFPEGLNPQPGQQLETETADGHPLSIRVVAVEGDRVTMDANHPLAGKELTFEIEVVSIA